MCERRERESASERFVEGVGEGRAEKRLHRVKTDNVSEYKRDGSTQQYVLVTTQKLMNALLSLFSSVAKQSRP